MHASYLSPKLGIGVKIHILRELFMYQIKLLITRIFLKSPPLIDM